jgi:hypothetical protein
VIKRELEKKNAILEVKSEMKSEFQESQIRQDEIMGIKLNTK